MKWHYGPTESDPYPGSMWHYDCGGQVWCIDDGLICLKCGEQEELEVEEPEEADAPSGGA